MLPVLPEFAVPLLPELPVLPELQPTLSGRGTSINGDVVVDIKVIVAVGVVLLDRAQRRAIRVVLRRALV